MIGNGETKNIDTEGLDVSTKLDILIEALKDFQEQFDEFREEVAEKLANISSDGPGFDIFTDDN